MSSSSASSAVCDSPLWISPRQWRFQSFTVEYLDELQRLRRFFVAKFDLAIREHVYQFLDKVTANAMLVLELEFYYPQLDNARRGRMFKPITESIGLRLRP